MKFFIDSGDITQIKELNSLGIVDGVTTNPSIIAKEKKGFFEILEEICQEVDGSVSAEVVATEHKKMLKEADKLIKISDKITIKLPLTWDGLKTCKILSGQGIDVNVTLCFSAAQALIAAKCGARYISPFIGRLDDIGYDGLGLITEIREIYDNYSDSLATEILAASIRHPIHLIECAKIGADIATIPPALAKQLIKHPLTDRGLEVFLQDWHNSKKEI